MWSCGDGWTEIRTAIFSPLVHWSFHRFFPAAAGSLCMTQKRRYYATEGFFFCVPLLSLCIARFHFISAFRDVICLESIGCERIIQSDCVFFALCSRSLGTNLNDRMGKSMNSIFHSPFVRNEVVSCHTIQNVSNQLKTLPAIESEKSTIRCFLNLKLHTDY